MSRARKGELAVPDQRCRAYKMAPSDGAERRQWIARIIAGCCACVLAGCANSSSAHGATATVRGPMDCQGAMLSIRVIRSVAAGPIAGGYLSFTNRSNRRCRVTGWPIVSAVKRSGASSPALKVHTTQFGPNVSGIPIVMLSPGDHADAVFTATTLDAGRNACGKPYHLLAVRAPRSRRTVLLSAWNKWLGAYLPSCSRVSISMIVPAASLYRG
jgi:hypothetical protein